MTEAANAIMKSFDYYIVVYFTRNKNLVDANNKPVLQNAIYDFVIGQCEVQYSSNIPYYKVYENKISNRNWNISSKCFSIIPEVCKERIEILLAFYDSFE